MDNFDSALVLLTAALFYALLIERLIEIIIAVYDFFEVKLRWSQRWNTAALSMAEELDQQIATGNRLTRELAKAGKDYLTDDHPGYEGVKALSAKRFRVLTIKTVSKILAVILGVSLAFLMNINLFQYLDVINSNAALLNGESVGMSSKYFSSNNIPPWLGLSITGIAIGLGSGPVHKIIQSLEKKRKQRKTETDV